MKKILALITLAAILFGAKFYMESRYEKGLDRVLAQSSPFVSVRYDDLNIELDGSLSISGLELRSPEIKTPIFIDDINISSSDRLFLFRGENAYIKGDLPDSFSIAIDAFGFESSLIPLQDPENECKSIAAGIDYSKLGEPQIIIDAKIDLDTSDLNNVLITLLSTNKFSTTRGQFSFSMANLGLNKRTTEDIPINTFSISDNINQVHAQKVIRYCAKKLNLRNEEFVDNIIGSSEFTQELVGVDLGYEFQEALKSYIQGSSTLKINGRPSDQLKKIGSTKLFKKSDVVKMLNLTVQLDGNAIPIEVTELLPVEGQLEQPDKVIEKVTPVVESDIEETPLDPRIVEKIRSEKQKKNRKSASYRLTELSQANTYKGHSVRVKRKDKTDVSGRLKNYNAISGQLEVDVTQYGGNVLFTIDRSEISRLEVYR